MSPVMAVALLIVLFIAFGLMNKGASKPSCRSCDHKDQPDGCGACDADSRVL